MRFSERRLWRTLRLLGYNVTQSVESRLTFRKNTTCHLLWRWIVAGLILTPWNRSNLVLRNFGLLLTDIVFQKIEFFTVGTRMGIGKLGNQIRFSARTEIFLLPTAFRPTMHLIQRAPGILLKRVKHQERQGNTLLRLVSRLMPPVRFPLSTGTPP
jgi:hypothetical protein